MVRKPVEPRYGTPDDESPELTADDFAKMRPFPEVMAELGYSTERLRGPHSVVVTTAVDLPVELVEPFRAQGEDWRARIADVLRAHLERTARSKKSA